MDTRAVGCMMALACAAHGARASEVVEGLPGAPDAACRMPAAKTELQLMGHRAELVALYGSLPVHCLKKLFMACNTAASQALLDIGSAATCSVGYEALLATGFAGDFHALMAWWRMQREAAAAAP